MILIGAAPAPGGDRSTMAVSDVHGHRDELCQELSACGVVDGSGHWSAGAAELIVLGDLLDRGPHGVEVVDLVRRLQREAAETQGRVTALLGNHEVQFLAAHHFGARPVGGLEPFADWLSGWRHFGGRDRDLRAVTDDQVEWLGSLPLLDLRDRMLFAHSDTDRYLELGGSMQEVNERARAVLNGRDPAAWLGLCDVLSDRGAFRDARRLDRLLTGVGADAVVHGHSPLREHFGVRDPAGHPFEYAGGRATAIDGGVFDGGELVVASLDQDGRSWSRTPATARPPDRVGERGGAGGRRTISATSRQGAL